MTAANSTAVRIDDSHDWVALRDSYNYPSPRNRRAVFVNLLRAEALRLRHRGGRVRALDIGCGTGISEDVRVNQAYLAGIRERVDELWGAEPDDSVQPAPGMFDRFFPTTLESLDLKGETVDLAYSYMVQEHVEDADAFFSALARHMAPGAVYVGLTINARHGFALITRLLRQLRLEEIALRLVRGRVHYHYPVRYRANDIELLRAVAIRAGFHSPTFATLEQPTDTVGYFKGPLRPLHWLMQWKRLVLRRPNSLLTLVMRVEKSDCTHGETARVR